MILSLNACRTKQQIVVEKEIVKYVHSDTTIVHDSTVYIPVEKIVDIVPVYDTLVLSTSVAESKSWVDTTNHMLRGEIKNLAAVEIKYIEIEKIVTNDSIIEKEIPYPVEVIKTKAPKWSWWTLMFTILVLGFIGIKVYLKFKPL